MTNSDLHSACARLSDLLAAERDLLRAGRARDAAALIADKTDALETLERGLAGADPSILSRDLRERIHAVMRLAGENAVHFDAVRNGLRGAIERLETMHANAYVGAYSIDGSRTAFPEATGKYKKIG